MATQVVSSDPVMGISNQGIGIDEMEMMEIQKSQSENVVERAIKKFAAGMQAVSYTHLNRIVF